MRTRPALSLILALACLGLAACGGGGSSSTSSEAMTPQQYEEFLKKVSQRENESQGTIQEGLQAKSMDQLTKALSAFATDQEARAEELASVTPPKNAETAHANLEKAFEDTAAAVKEVIPQVEKAGSPQAGLEALRKAQGPQQAGHELESALVELSKLKYTPGG